MTARKSIELEVLTLIQQKSCFVGLDETFEQKVSDTKKRTELLNALRDNFGYGQVPPQINTPRKLANWIGDCRCLKDDDNIVLAGLRRYAPSFRLATAA